MISIARENLFHEGGKFATSVAGVSLSILVILAPFGVYFGSLAPSKALPEKSGADLWIVQEGSGDLFHTSSILPAGFDEELENIEGVRSASPIINHAGAVDINGQNVTTAILGFDNENRIAAPWAMFEGTADLESGEMVIDRSLAHIYGLEIGDTVTIAEEEFLIAGISLETNVLVFQYAFITSEDAARVFQQQETVNYYLLNIEDGSRDRVRAAAKDIVPNSQIRTKETIAESNGKVIQDSFLPVLSILAVIGLFVGATVIGLTVYSLTTAKIREYGVLKAIGVPDGKLYRIVFAQALLTSLGGFVGGVLLYLCIQWAAFSLLPQVNFLLPTELYGYTFVLALVMSVFASFLPIRKINTLDPAQVFKS